MLGHSLPSAGAPASNEQGSRLRDVAAAAPPCAPPLIGRSAAMLRLRNRLDRLAHSNASVLILGETGTGKEIAARYVHTASTRRDAPFIALNCAALPEALMESELFGHARGAFTGAHQSYKGKIRLAQGGTLFLDEIGDMPLPAQAKMLRFLESGEIFGVGALRTEIVDVRIVAATNHDLAERVRQGLFRKDLYYRLNIAQVELCPLSQRKSDMDELTAYFLRGIETQYGTRVKGLSAPVRRLFLQHTWPGNVRELKNVLESAALQADSDRIEIQDLPGYLCARMRAPEPLSEREMLVNTLTRTNWNKSAAAQQLNWSRMTLYRKLAKYAL
jgi:transcriptional regulator with PAS, ATPase and Fis domain